MHKTTGSEQTLVPTLPDFAEGALREAFRTPTSTP